MPKSLSRQDFSKSLKLLHSFILKAEEMHLKRLIAGLGFNNFFHLQ
jgi:hypothetical protein